MDTITKNNWCEEGLKVLAKEGFQKITIDNLCIILKRTKGSFYHHFQNINGYIESLMEYWLEKNTIAFIKQTEQISNAEEKCFKLNKLASSASHKAEQSIRAWSFSNGIVKQYVQKVDDMRMDYLIMLNIQSGMEKKESKDYAIIEYSTLIGIQQLHPNISEEDFTNLYLMFIDKVGIKKR